MTLPTHKFRVPRRVVDDVFGSEVELIAAINRYVQNLDGRLWDPEKMTEVTIPHDTWEKFRNGQGGMDLVSLRSVIMLAIWDHSQARNGRQPGTLMIAQKETGCPFCERPVEPGALMVNTYGPEGGTHAAHVSCANRENIPYRATPKLREGIIWLKRRTIERYLEKQLETARKR